MRRTYVPDFYLESISTILVLIYYNEFPKSQNTSVDRWSRNKKPSDESGLQELASDANTSSSLPTGWIRTEFLTPTSNVCIPCWLKVTKVTSSYVMHFISGSHQPQDLLRPTEPLSTWPPVTEIALCSDSLHQPPQKNSKLRDIRVLPHFNTN
jgi:hypothetical protein